MSTRRITRRGRWLPAHEVWLENNYALLGSDACARHLRRTPKSVESKAARLGISQLIAPAGYCTTAELDRDLGFQPGAAWTAARRANAIVGGTRARLVTEAWANAYRESCRSRARARDMRDAGALSLEQAARELGIYSQTLRKAVASGRGRVANAIKDRVTRATKQDGRAVFEYVFQPAHVLDAARRLREHARKEAA